MLESFVGKVFGTKNERELKKYQKRVIAINSLEQFYKKMNDDELKAAFAELQNLILNETQSLSDVLEKSFAKILVYLKNQIPNTVNSSDSSREFDEVCTFRHHFEYDKAGYLLPLSCGHSGHFSNAEIALLETHLTRISFIK